MQAAFRIIRVLNSWVGDPLVDLKPGVGCVMNLIILCKKKKKRYACKFNLIKIRVGNLFVDLKSGVVHVTNPYFIITSKTPMI